MVDVLRGWSRRRWLSAGLAAVLSCLVVAVPTAMVPTGVFGRAVPSTAWAWPVLLVTSILAGLLFATYVREDDHETPPDRGTRAGATGGFLTFLAVGCPVCNKVALLALGYTGALRWFAPVQPFLAVLGVILLGWALVARLRGEVACPVAMPAGEPARRSS